MVYGFDEEDYGGDLANMNFEADMCEEYEGECKKCPCRHNCEYSEYIKKDRKKSRRY